MQKILEKKLIRKNKVNRYKAAVTDMKMGKFSTKTDCARFHNVSQQ